MPPIYNTAQLAGTVTAVNAAGTIATVSMIGGSLRAAIPKGIEIAVGDLVPVINVQSGNTAAGPNGLISMVQEPITQGVLALAGQASSPDNPDPVIPDPPVTPPVSRVVSISKSIESGGARIDIATNASVSTYGRDNTPPWTSTAQDPATRTFDLTLLPYDTDIQVRIDFVTGVDETFVVHTLPATPPADPDPIVGVQARQADNVVDIIGVDTHMHYNPGVYDAVTTIRDLLTNAGIRHIRDYPINTGALGTLMAAGIKLSAIIGNPHQGSWTASLATYKANVEALVAAHPGGIDCIEGTNEPDITIASNIAAWGPDERIHQQAIWDWAKATTALQNITIAGPSVTFDYNTPTLGIISAWCDVGNIHPYPGGRPPSDRVSTDMAASRANNVGANKDIIATETGYHNAINMGAGNHRPASEAAAGIYMARLWLHYFDIGIKRAFAYELCNEGTDLTAPEQNFGLVSKTYVPKPAYNSTKNLIALLADPGASFAPGALDYSLTGGDSLTHAILLQKRNGHFWLAVFQDTSVYDQVNKVTLDPVDRPMTLHLPSAKTVKTYSPTVSTTATSTQTASSLGFNSSERVLLFEIY